LGEKENSLQPAQGARERAAAEKEMTNPMNKKCSEMKERNLFLNLLSLGNKKRRTNAQTDKNCRITADIPRIKLK
jgi:hypothetical protein